MLKNRPVYTLNHPNEERNKEIYQMRMRGATLSAIGKRFGISGARVTQVINSIERRKKKIDIKRDLFVEMRHFPDIKFKN